MRGHIAFNPDYVLLLVSGLTARPHRHLSASITISLDEPFLVKAGERTEMEPARLLIMRPDELNSSDCKHSRIINLQLDPETQAYARLKNGLLANEAVVVRDDYPVEWRNKLLALADQKPFVGQRIVDALLDFVGSPEPGKIAFDRRVAQALQILKTRFPEAPTSGEIAEQVGLSESRLMHLFREQVGVPLRRYTLWLRVRHVFFCIATGANLTDAAHEAGFADSSHLSRVFSDMFGLAASSLVRSEQVTRSFEIPQMPLRGPHAEQDAARLQHVLLTQPDAIKRLVGARSPESQ